MSDQKLIKEAQELQKRLSEIHEQIRLQNIKDKVKYKNVFTSNLNVQKRRLGYTQQQIATKLNKKRSAVGAWFEGRSEPSIEDQPVLMDVLHISDWRQFITVKIA